MREPGDPAAVHTPSTSLAGLSSAAWGALQQVVRDFEGAWARGAQPRIEAYLERSTGDRAALLVELVHTEVELRLRAGEPVTAREYLARFPELESDPTVVRGLAAAAAQQRRERGPATARDVGPPGHAERNGIVLPARLGKYELVELVGSGSFGSVYRARDTELGRTVAVKVPSPDRLNSAREADRFLREARVAARLSHPGIVPVHDVGRVDATCFLVCQFVAGSTLSDRIAAGPLPPR
jgi:hypothetical protein